MRYVNVFGRAAPRFLNIIEKVRHKSEEMEVSILRMLEKYEIDVQDCRGQSYDNTSNMSGIYTGLQARIKAKNKLAVYVPCAPHSLNLIGQHAAESCLEASKLNDLCVLSIETELLNRMDHDAVINEFANKNCRRKQI